MPTGRVDWDALPDAPGLKDAAPLGEPQKAPTLDLSAIPSSVSGQLRDMYHQIRTSPDVEGKIIELSAKTGIPEQTVRNRIADAERIANQPDWDALEKANPALARQLADDLELFRLANDKETLENLNLLGKALHWGAGAAPDMDPERTAKQVPGALGAGLPSMGANLYKFGAESINLYQEALRGVGIEPWGGLETAREELARQGTSAEAFAESLRGDRTGLSSTEQAFLSGLESVTQSAASLMAMGGGVSPVTALVTLFGAPTAGESLEQARKRGLSGWESVLYATEQATSEVASELIPGLKFLGDVKAGAPLWTILRHQVFNETWTEEVNLALQEFSSWMHLYPEKTLSEFADEYPEKAYQVAIATLTTVGFSTTAGVAISHLSGVYGSEQQKTVDAEAWRNRLAEIAELTRQSKLRTTSPQKFQSVVTTMLEQAGSDTVYVNANEFSEYLQSQNVNPMEVASQLTGVAAQLPEAMLRNGDLRIPAGEFITHLATSPIAEGMLDIVRPNIESMSAKEAADWQAGQAELFENLAKQVEAQHAQDTEWQQSADQVHNFIRDQIVQTGRFDEQTAEKYATLHRAFAQVVAARLGLQPHQVYERYGLQVGGAPILAGEGVLDQEQARIDQWTQEAHNTDLDAATDWVVERVPISSLQPTEEGVDQREAPGVDLDARPIKVGADGITIMDGHGRYAEALRRGATDVLVLKPTSEAGAGTGQVSIASGVGGEFNQSATLRRGTETLESYGLNPALKHNTRDVAAALEKRQREKYGTIEIGDYSDEASQKIARWIGAEVRFEMENPGKSGVGWYSEKFQKALDVFSERFPELKTDQNARDIFTALVAITSDGQKVTLNFKYAAQVYEGYSKNKRLNETFTGGGDRNKSIVTNIKNINKMLAEKTPEEMKAFLLQEHTVSKLKQLARAEGHAFKSQYKASTRMPMSAVIFGEKLGAFYANLMGSHGYLTMDRWWSRTFNRYRGTLLDAPTTEGLARFRGLLAGTGVDVFNMSNEEIMYAVVPFAKAYEARKFKRGSEIEKAANTIYKAAFVNLRDAPQNASDREFMLKTVSRAQRNLKRAGFDLNIADIQAILWYYEKRLYGELGARQTADISYEEAARAAISGAESPEGTIEMEGPDGTIVEVPPPGTTLAGINIEIAPDPNDPDLTAAFNSLSPEAKRQATFDVAADLLPEALEELGVEDYEIQYTTGGYLEEVNPSLVVQIPGKTLDELEEIGKVLGYIASQQAIVSYDESVTEGEGVAPFVKVVPSRELTYEEQGALYEHLRLSAPGVEGYTWRDGALVIGDFSGVGDAFADNIKQALQDYDLDVEILKSKFQARLTDVSLEGTRYGQGDSARSDEGGRAVPGRGRGSTASRIEGLRTRGAALLRGIIDNAQGGITLNQGPGTGGPAEGDVRVSAPPVRPDGQVELTHWSRQENLGRLDPAFHGTGISGAESRRKANDPENWVDRTYYGIAVGQPGGYSKEVGLGARQYTAAVPAERLYDLKADPDGLRTQSRAEAQETGGDPTSVLERMVRDAGYAGYWVADPSMGLVSAVFEALQPEASTTLEQQNRGSIRFPADITQAPSVIALLETADLSTFLHESGHFFFEVYRDLASQPDADPQILADMQALLKFVGVPDLETWNTMTPEERRAGHEKVAEAFEQYLFGGDAPSLGLRKLFQTFASWLRHVYRALGGPKAALTDEVKGVFDRMLASEDEIKAAETLRQYLPLFESIDRAGMSTEDWAEYQALGSEATSQAADALERRSLRDLKWTDKALAKELKRLQREVKARRAEVRKEAEDLLYEDRLYAVRRYLTHGDREPPAGNQAARRLAQALSQENHKLSKESLLDMYGDGPAAPWRYLPTGKRGMMAQEGIHPNELAELFGYGPNAGDQLVRELLEARPPEEVIEEMTDNLMLERYGDLTSPQKLQEAAEEAVHSEARLKFFATELKALDSLLKARGDTGRTDVKGRKITYNVLAAAAKDYAEQAIARKTVREAPRTAEYQAAEIRAGKAALAAMQADDIQQAAEHKRAQLLNAHFHRAATEAGREIEKALRFLRKFEKPGVRKKLSQDYLDQIDQLLERYDLRKSVTLNELRERASLKAWVDRQAEAGLVPAIPQKLIDQAQKQHYTQMTLDEFRGLRDAIKSIDHLGRLKKKLLTAKDQREFDAIIDAAVASIEANSRGKKPQSVETDLPQDKLRKGIGEFFAMHRKLADLLREMDGWQDNGAMWNLLMRPLNDALNMEAVMREESTIVLNKLFQELHDRGRLYQKTEVGAGVPPMTKMGRLMVALNLGNDTNRKRLNDSGWTPEKIDAVTSTLTKEDWDFVQAIWDHIGSFWPLIQAKEKRVTGVAPEGVQAVPVVTPFGEYRGGYFPIKYDKEQSPKAFKQEVAETARLMMRGAFTRAATRRGHLEQRVEEVKRPLDLSFGVIFGHLEQVIHDLALHEYLIDQNRVLNDARMEGAILENYGHQVYKQLTNAMTDVAMGDVPATNAFEHGLNWLRVGASIAGMAWKLTTASLQPLGLTQSMSRIGTKWVARGMSRWLRSSADSEATVAWIHSKSDFMRLRSKTLQREISEIRNRIQRESWFRDQVNAAARAIGMEQAPDMASTYFLFIVKMQMVADVPTWLGQYEKSMAQGVSEEQAVALADQAVLDSQGGGQVKDLAAIQRGSPLLKLWTNFYSYFNVTYNRNVEAFKRTNYKSPASIGMLGIDLMLLNVIPSVLATLMYEGLRGRCSGEPECIAKKIATDQASYVLGTIVGARELTSAFTGYGYGGPAGVRFMEAASRLGDQVAQGELDEAFFKALNGAAGVLFHYPAGQVEYTVQGITALATGETNNPAAVAFGAPK